MYFVCPAYTTVVKTNNYYCSLFMGYPAYNTMKYSLMEKKLNRFLSKQYELPAWLVVCPSWSCGRVSLPLSTPSSWTRQPPRAPCSLHPRNHTKHNLKNFNCPSVWYNLLKFNNCSQTGCDGETSIPMFQIRINHKTFPCY